ncbi:hypothetical protein Vc3S01_A0201 [Vibrio campbellii]|nr:hypothetical protein Vc3S01_A0201 [Vibrio campbellii]
MVFIRKHSSLTIWKADKTNFKFVCKVLKVFLIEYSKQHIQVFLEFESGKIEMSLAHSNNERQLW